MVEKTLAQIHTDELAKKEFFKSPVAWEDQVLYFLMLDRFSDGQEDGYRDIQGNKVAGSTPLFRNEDNGNAIQNEEEAERWRQAGGRWTGGTLKGLTSKIGYLKRLGVTAIWVSPIFKQVACKDTYHGYGIQNFLAIDPHFGTKEDLRELVQAAHQNGLYVILDIILNHAGDVFEYRPEVCGQKEGQCHPSWNGHVHEVQGFNNAQGEPTLEFKLVAPEQESEPGRMGPFGPESFNNRRSFRGKAPLPIGIIIRNIWKEIFLNSRT